MVAGALRRRVWIDERWFQWTPNFYIVLVGPPGVAAKSTTAKIGYRLLAEVPGIHFGPASITWQALIVSLEEAKELVAMPGTTEDDLLSAERFPMACVTSVVSELGTFLKPHDDDMIDVLVDLWDGQLGPAWERKTKTSGQGSIENPWLNVIGCTTPGWMRRNFPEHLIHGGLTSRIIFVYADKKRQLVAFPSEVVDADEFEAEGKRLVEDLVQISELFGAYEKSKEAIVWGTDWYKALWASRPAHMASDRYDGYISRKQTHVMKLAIVLAASSRNELVITKEDMETANRFITALEDDMSKVFESIGVADSSRTVAELITYVRAYKKISSLQLWRLCISTMDKKAYDDAIQAAVQANYIRIRNEAGTMIIRPVYEKGGEE